MGLGDIFKGLMKGAGGAAERSSGYGLKAAGNFLREGAGSIAGGVLKSMWGTEARRGLYGEARASIPGVLRELMPSIRRGSIGALPKFGMAAGLDAYLETPDADQLTGAQRFGLQAVSFGMRFGAYRSLARGVAGTVLGGAGRMVGQPGAYAKQYGAMAKALGPMWQSGSLTNMAFRGVLKGAREVAYTPVRAVLGIPGAITAGAGTAARVIGDTGIGRMIGMGRLADRMGASSISAAMHPRIGGAFGRGLAKVGLVNKMQDAPIMSTAIALGMGAQYFKSKAEYNERNANWLGGPKYNPANYGGGITAMRRGGAQNYGPALTLMLHGNGRRVMS